MRTVKAITAQLSNMVTELDNLQNSLAADNATILVKSDTVQEKAEAKVAKMAEKIGSNQAEIAAAHRIALKINDLVS